MNTTRFIRLFFSSLPVWAFLICLPAPAGAQTDSSDSTGVEKGATSIELVYTESNNHDKLLSATVKTKIDDTYQGVKGIALQCYQKEAATENLLGSAVTNEKGRVEFLIPEGKLPPATEYTFLAAIENDANLEDTQEEITVGEADFTMALSEEDSVRQVIVTLQAPDAKTGELSPVAEAEVHLYVQRLFGLLPLSADAETTDENGEVTVKFPAGIPGDTAGNLVIVARVEENDRFGNLEFRRKINWGTTLIIDPNRDMRKLWSSRANAPIYLILLVNTMLIGIWGVILYIVYQVFRIKKIGRQNAS